MTARKLKIDPRLVERARLARSRRPFWLPASNYYVLSVAITMVFFFLIWGILRDDGSETPFINAGISAGMVLIGAVILREIILRRARNRYIRLERDFDRRLTDAYSMLGNERADGKMSLEENSEILREIKQKSDAANVLSKLSAGHREVFELCAEYLARAERELRLIGPGSPRMIPLRKGRDKVRGYHRFHLLHWAEIESTTLTIEARNRVKLTERVESAQKAINVIDSALEVYPNEVALLESRDVVTELLASIKVTHWVEQAERAAFKGQYKQARSLYRDALFYLGRDQVNSESRQIAAEKINAEIERLQQLEDVDRSRRSADEISPLDTD